MSEMPAWVETFKWDSEDQKKGFQAYIYWARSHGLDASVHPSDLFFIQKDHESNEYWREMVSAQIRMLQEEIRRLHEIIAQLK